METIIIYKYLFIFYNSIYEHSVAVTVLVGHEKKKKIGGIGSAKANDINKNYFTHDP